MRIIVFAALYYPFKGGYVESIHELAKHLIAQGCTITIITCNTHLTLSKDDIDGVQIYRLPCFNPCWLNNTFPIPLPTLTTLRLLRSALKERPNIISTQTRFFPTSWLGFFIAKLLRIPVIHTERGATHSVASSRITSWIAAIIDHTCGWMLARFSSASVGVSEASCQFLQHLGARNPVKIYNGVEVEFWKPIRNHESIRKIRNEIVITFIGRLIYAKGIQDLLHAVAQLKNNSTIEQYNITINLIGDGPYRSRLEALTKELGLQNQVLFLGELAKEQIRDILWQPNIFVNPSHSEGLPRSVLEAAAAGLPIIATDVGGTREIISDDRGVLVSSQNIDELTNALSQLISNSPKAQEVGEQAQAYVEKHFGWDQIVDQYLKLFQKLCVE